MNTRERVCWMILLAGLSAGCAGVRTGFFSRPFTGEPARGPGPSTAFERDRMLDIRLPGLAMKVDLLNSWQLSDSTWFGIGVPLFPLRVKRGAPPAAASNGTVRIELQALQPGIEVDAARLVLSVDGANSRPSSFQAYVWTTGRWDSVTTEAPLELAVGRSYRFELRYPVPRPLPDRDIQLELNEAVRAPGRERLPAIRFEKKKYREYYG